jgi:hypothetical protein
MKEEAGMATKEGIDPVLQDLKQRLIARLGDRLVRLVLFGSRARGDYDSDSDIDIAVVVKGLQRDEKMSILDEIAEVELEHLVPVSTFIVSQEEYNRLLERERRIALDIKERGVPL